MAAPEINKVHVWDVQNGRKIHVLDFRGNTIWSLAFSPDSRILVVAGGTRTKPLLKFVDVKSGKVRDLKTTHTASIRLVLFLPDGRFLLTATTDSRKDELKLREIETGKELNSPEEGMQLSGFSPIRLSPGGLLFALVRNRTVSVQSMPYLLKEGYPTGAAK